MAEKAIRKAGRRYPLALRLRILRLLFGRNRKLSFTRRLTFLSRRFGPSTRQIFRWVALYRKAGANELRDRMRSDLLTRRARNAVSITPDAPALVPLDGKAHAATPRATELPS